MSCCELCGEESSTFANYFPQFIGVIGTLLGTFLGWFLKFLQDNMGKTEVIIEHFENFIDSSNSYAFYLSLFICNHSVQLPRHLHHAVQYSDDCRLQIGLRHTYGNDASAVPHSQTEFHF